MSKISPTAIPMVNFNDDGPSGSSSSTRKRPGKSSPAQQPITASSLQANKRRRKTEKNAKHKDPFWSRVIQKVESWSAGMETALRYVAKDVKIHKRSFAIGMITVFLVVFFITVLSNAIAKSPFIFIKLSENEVGEYDMLMLPQVNNQSQAFFLNSTDIERRLSSVPEVKGVAPRWVLQGKISNPQSGKATSCVVLVIDSEKEKKIGLGRGWTRRPLGEQESYISGSILRQVGVEGGKGQRVNLNVDLVKVASGLNGFGAATGNGQSSTEQLARQVATQLGFNFQGNTTFNITGGNVPVPGLPIPIPIAPQQVTVPNEQLFETAYPQFIQLLNFTTDLLVVDGVELPDGKWPASLGNVVVVESKYLLDTVADGVGTNQDPVTQAALAAAGFSQQQIRQQLNAINLDEFALSVVVMNRDRIEAYQKSDQTQLDLDMITWTNKVSEGLGVDFAFSAQLPVRTALGLTYFIRLFLDQIFSAVTVFLVILGSMLIYSLLISDVEEKTYEYGMLRALGMEHSMLVEVLTSQALLFSIPAICIALFLCFLVGIPVSLLIADYAVLPPQFGLSSETVLLAFCLGIIMPIISNILPIQRALGKTLRDALDLYHQSVNDSIVSVEKLEELGISGWQTAISIMMIVIGFIVYYVIPFSFLFNYLPLFLSILNGILLGMLLGLSLIAVNLQPYLEKVMVDLMLWGRFKSLGVLVRKNLGGHRSRNLKTALMFTTALAFIVFAAAMFSLQAVTIKDNVQQNFGADMVIQAPDWQQPLDKDSMSNYLQSRINDPNDDLVSKFTFVTFPLLSSPLVSGTIVGNLAGYGDANVRIFGLERTYLESTYQEFYVPVETDPSFTYKLSSSGRPDAIKSIYDDAGKATPEGDLKKPTQDVVNGYREKNMNQGPVLGGNRTTDEAYSQYFDIVVGESLRLSQSLRIKEPCKIIVKATKEKNTAQLHSLSLIRAMVQKVPGFFFTAYRGFSSNTPLLMSIENYQSILNWAQIQVNTTNTTSTTQSGPILGIDRDYPLHYERLLIKLRDNTTLLDRESVANGLRNFLPSDAYQVLDTASLVDTTALASNLILLFFNLVAVISSVLCFFMLWLSFTANVKENSWEFGVLRSIGLNSTQVTLMYIFEALALIASAVIMGSIIGIAIAITLTLQFNLFTEMPFKFVFPTALFFSVIAMSIVVAIVGSYLPARKYNRKQIAIILRGN
eukprot:TRINITY_DN2635_c0_g2_i3.p1 TRINITY_DN2635_c0_g2~~TRINITY_DN2635_c0_g2_i3.p1  ORF type:complete len:1218 (-),score=362.13 TRINITY_DN2635_c0_g2_i3:46-3648(-)